MPKVRFVVASLAVAGALSLGGLVWSLVSHADEPELNLYTSRHYQTDEALYERFTELTGIRINRLEGKGDQLIERIRSGNWAPGWIVDPLTARVIPNRRFAL